MARISGSSSTSTMGSTAAGDIATSRGNARASPAEPGNTARHGPSGAHPGDTLAPARHRVAGIAGRHANWRANSGCRSRARDLRQPGLDEAGPPLLSGSSAACGTVRTGRPRSSPRRRAW
jgi:hypothetical protein